MTADEGTDLLHQFETCRVNPAEFGHREHVQVAFEMLHKYSYVEACSKYANAINTIATNAGAADKFHVTITFAFLSLIAERVYATDEMNFDLFIKENPALLSPNALNQWYSSKDLESDFARRNFLLPSNAG